MTDLSRKQTIAMPQFPRLTRLDKAILWLAMSNAAEMSRRIRTDYSLADVAPRSFSVMDRRAGSVESAALNPDFFRIIEVFL